MDGKYLCLIRHGQGEHNPRSNPLALAFLPAMFKRDARLTGKGKAQAQALQQPMQHLPFDLILVSPLTRTILTAALLFHTLEASGRQLSIALEPTLVEVFDTRE